MHPDSTCRGTVEFGYHRSSNWAFLLVAVPVLLVPLALYFRLPPRFVELAIPTLMIGGMVVFFATMLYRPNVLLALQDSTLNTQRWGSLPLHRASIELAPWRMPNAGVPLGSVLQIRSGTKTFRVGGHGHALADGLYTASAQFYVHCTMPGDEFERLLTSLGFSRTHGFRTEGASGRQRFEFLPEALTGKIAFQSLWRWAVAGVAAVVVGNALAAALPPREGMLLGGLASSLVLLGGLGWIVLNARKLPAPTRVFEVSREQLWILDAKGAQIASSPLAALQCERLQHTMHTNVGTWVFPVLRIRLPGRSPLVVYAHGSASWDDGVKPESSAPELQLGAPQWNDLVRALRA